MKNPADGRVRLLTKPRRFRRGFCIIGYAKRTPCAFFAFSFLTLGVLTGALWSNRVFGQLWFWDPKETWFFITWLIFLAYLHARYTLEWRGRCAAILAIVGFVALLFTYVGVDFLLPQIDGT